ncbi:hypothetical protein V6Z11_D13G080500 [Gossypium hirsutum]
MTFRYSLEGRRAWRVQRCDNCWHTRAEGPGGCGAGWG